MLQSLPQMLGPAVMERATLILNHVLGGERVATERLLPHAGKTLQLHLGAWPSALPPPPRLAWRVTPAGLLEWCGEPPAAPELTLRLMLDHPAALASHLLSGALPPMDVAGDAHLAADVNWLTQNLRWDVAADLERLFPPLVAETLHRAGSTIARALRAALQGVDALRNRWRPR